MNQQDQLPESSSVALKEWAVVCEAIRRGRQRLLFRTGGISEENGQFEMKHPCFWLFPTRFHQATDLVCDAFARELSSPEKITSANQIPIDLFCKVQSVHFVDNFQKLLRLRDWHVLTEEVLQQRFEYRSPGLYVISFDAFHQKQVQWVENDPEYDGCHSWVDFKQEIPIRHRTLLSSTECEEELGQLAETLQQTVRR